jgi:hypothetical protein
MSSVADEANDLERTFKAVWYTDQAILALKLRMAELVARRRELAEKLIQALSASASEMDAGQGILERRSALPTKEAHGS